eukprot:TRINITY_DN5287_c0_g1_i1.p1 TRINITY_DN5287_c0_g1~~TRINITY_DN5287_c0_g1_i1.p1  ORF type:complete len:239 (+),score=52.72 TRINITY_DN5287_c0_g1_i1:100-816(+)
MRAVLRGTGGLIRNFGQSLESIGFKIIPHAHFETLVLHGRLVTAFGKSPVLSIDHFIAPNATIIGDVKLGQSSSVWYGAIVRAHTNPVEIGEETDIGNRVIINGLSDKQKVSIGSKVIIGDGSIIHSAILEDEVLLNNGVIVSDDVIIEKYAIIAPGTVLPPGTRVKAGTFWAGNPGVFIREITPKETDDRLKLLENQFSLAKAHETQWFKSERERDIDRNPTLWSLDHPTSWSNNRE